MSQRAYATRRGVSHVAVQKAIKTGRLKASVRDGKIIDADLADREWTAGTDLTRAPLEHPVKAGPPAPAPPSTDAEEPQEIRAPTNMAEALFAEKRWKAKSAELEYRREAGELVPVAEVEGEVRTRYLNVRTKLLGIPSRARQALPHLTVADIGALEQLVRESLEELAG